MYSYRYTDSRCPDFVGVMQVLFFESLCKSLSHAIHLKRAGKGIPKLSDCHFAAGTLHNLRIGRVGHWHWLFGLEDRILQKIITLGVNSWVDCCRFHGTDHFRPLWLGVDHHRVVPWLIGSKIYVYALPHSSWVQDHGWSGDAGGALLVLWHGWHSRVTFLISWSICGHHRWLRNTNFKRAIPGWPSCNSVIIVCLREGMTVRGPHRRQPCSTESSSLRAKYGLRSGSAQ